MNEFLKYLKMIPVIIYPYIYVLILAIFLLFAGILPEDYTDVALIGLLIVAVIYNLYSFIIVIVNAVQAAKGKMTARQAARMNLMCADSRLYHALYSRLYRTCHECLGYRLSPMGGTH